eukprot:748768-Hanusia_phi.AAC.1
MKERVRKRAGNGKVMNLQRASDGGGNGGEKRRDKQNKLIVTNSSKSIGAAFAQGFPQFPIKSAEISSNRRVWSNMMKHSTSARRHHAVFSVLAGTAFLSFSRNVAMNAAGSEQIEIERKFVVDDDVEDRLARRLVFKVVKYEDRRRGASEGNQSEAEIEDKYLDDERFALTGNDMWLRVRDGNFELKVPMEVDETAGKEIDRYYEINNTDGEARKAALGKVLAVRTREEEEAE